MENDDTVASRDQKLAIVQKAVQLRRQRLLNELRASTDAQVPTGSSEPTPPRTDECSPDGSSPAHAESRGDDKWHTLVENSTQLLERNHMNPADQSTFSLISVEKLREIDQYLERPIYSRIPWDRIDFAMALTAGALAAVLDIYVCTPNRYLHADMGDKDSWIGNLMEEVHKKHSLDKSYANPIDNLMPNVSSGPYHRGLSPGHDLACFVEGIRQIMRGEFRTIDWEDEIAYVRTASNTPQGTPYQKLPLAKAIEVYAIHMFCDYFSTTSLPIPGTYLLRQSTDHAGRVKIQDVYKSGIHLRYVTLQALPPALILLFFTTYCVVRYPELDSHEDCLVQKRLELTSLALGFSTAINIGKAVLIAQTKQNPLDAAFYLNYPELAVFCKTLLHLCVMERSRTSPLLKLRRNLKELTVQHQEIVASITEHLSQTYIFDDTGIHAAKL